MSSQSQERCPSLLHLNEKAEKNMIPRSTGHSSRKMICDTCYPKTSLALYVHGFLLLAKRSGIGTQIVTLLNR